MQDRNIFEQDLREVVSAPFIPWNDLKGATVLVTGITGLIGYTLAASLMEANREKNLNLKIVGLVRDMNRARDRFREFLLDERVLNFVEGSVEELPDINGNIDFIIHGAAQTGSKEFVSHPVETIDTAVRGTGNLLKLARKKNVKAFIYLSSMEVYGYPEKGHKVTENEIGVFSSFLLRNSYPISKIMCEAMCCAYVGEYNVPTKIIRLTQTFGAGVNYNDNRIFAYFLRCMNEKKDIILKTKGETERSYLYTTDAVTAILTVLLKGEKGKAYNAANEETYCSIAKMAELVAENAGVSVKYELQDEKINEYPKTLYMDLDTKELRKLGWNPGKNINLMEMYRRMSDWIGDEAK